MVFRISSEEGNWGWFPFAVRKRVSESEIQFTLSSLVEVWIVFPINSSIKASKQIYERIRIHIKQEVVLYKQGNEFEPPEMYEWELNEIVFSNSFFCQCGVCRARFLCLHDFFLSPGQGDLLLFRQFQSWGLFGGDESIPEMKSVSRSMQLAEMQVMQKIQCWKKRWNPWLSNDL